MRKIRHLLSLGIPSLLVETFSLGLCAFYSGINIVQTPIHGVRFHFRKCKYKPTHKDSHTRIGRNVVLSNTTDEVLSKDKGDIGTIKVPVRILDVNY